MPLLSPVLRCAADVVAVNYRGAILSCPAMFGDSPVTAEQTHQERFDAAVRLEQPDRVPVAPMILFFAARHAGVTMADFVNRRRAALDALRRTFEDLGGWDCMFSPGTIDAVLYAFEVPMTLKLPGRDIPEDEIWQAHEVEVMRPEEYEVLTEMGWSRFFINRILPRVRPGYGGSFWGKLKLHAHMARTIWSLVREVRYWRKRGVPSLVGSSVGTPFETLSACRSFEHFFFDLADRPDAVLAAMDAMLPDLIDESLKAARMSGIPRVLIGGSRGAGEFLSSTHFERFYLPWFKQMVEAFHQAGLVSVLHFDSNWTANLPYFKQLPRGSCILELDGTTDIFKAKEVLDDHLCLMGDVPATMLAMGTPDEVTAYCRKLIDVCGDGGGFILSSGCEVPSDAKFENVKAMIDSVKT